MSYTITFLDRETADSYRNALLIAASILSTEASMNPSGYIAEQERENDLVAHLDTLRQKINSELNK